MLGYSPTKTQELLGNPDKSANPTASSPACAGLAGEQCIFKEYLREARFRRGGAVTGPFRLIRLLI